MFKETAKNVNKKMYITTAIMLALCVILLFSLVMHEISLDRERTEILEELELNAGQYDETSIVLYGTNHVEASQLDVLVCDICGEVLDVRIHGEILDKTYGDVNGDRTINGKDAT